MLDHSTRSAVLRLRQQGHGTRAIARALGVSRGAVREVLRSAQAEVPRLERAEKAAEHHASILELYAACKGNLVRVHEELAAQGAHLSYQALTGYCRRHGIGHEPRLPSGRYHFEPGEEMQHDTSPHRVTIAGVLRAAQAMSLVLCHSRMTYSQYSPTFTRFDCKVFLTEGIEYFDGAAQRCMIDNTHVVVLRGTGADMVPVPEMAAFAERFGFTFAAHEVGDANRSARVEGPFDDLENNFEAGRTFSSWADLNRQARAWCDRRNAAHSAKLHASRRELFATERLALRALPIHVPEVYQLHQRIVDTEGYVSVHCVRYSVPYRLMGRRLEVRETKERIDAYDGPRLGATHAKRIDEHGTHVTDPSHRPARGEGAAVRPPAEDEEILRRAPELAAYLATLRERKHRLAVRGLLRLVREYPREPLVAAVCVAHSYGLYDVARLERMVLRQIASDFFVLTSAPGGRGPHGTHHSDDPEGSHEG